MNKLILTAAAAFAISSPLAAQSAQDQLDARYDRALAAGYKALFLCSAIANAEANGATRTVESVHQWELTGIQAPLDAIVRDLSFEVVRRPSGHIAHVQVGWADDMPDRVAIYFGYKTGCSIMPIGTPEDYSNPDQPAPQVERVYAGQGPSRLPTLDEAPSGLETLLDAAIAGREYGQGSRTTATLVLDGEAVAASRYAEGYDWNTPQRTWSVAKSIAATVVGMAMLSGEHEINDPVGINYWRRGGAADLRREITIDHALRMASGRYSDTPGNRTDAIYWGGATVDERATHWPMIHQPGTVFRYANNDTLMAVKAVEPFVGFYGVDQLIARFGMHHSVIETDSRGGAVLSSQVWATAEDLARMGQLHLQDGVWDGERLLPEGWVDYISAPSGPQPEGRGWGYGAGWWLLNRSEGIPPDTFLAAGNRGQYVVVVPARNVVIVRRGEDPVGSRFDIEAFTRDVLAALEE